MSLFIVRRWCRLPIGGFDEWESDDDSMTGDDESESESGNEDERVNEFIEKVRNSSEEIIDQKISENPTIIEDLWPGYHGAGFYRSIALMNHSCDPNLKVGFTETTSKHYPNIQPFYRGGQLRIIEGIISESLIFYNGRFQLFVSSYFQVLFNRGTNKATFVTLKPIHPGEQLFISYIPFIETVRSKRISLLLHSWGFSRLHPPAIVSMHLD